MKKLLRFLFSKFSVIEIIFRYIYWKFNLVKYFNFKESSNDNELYNFDIILENLKRIGVKKGTILIVHSSFDSLINCSIKPQIVINKLIDIIGEDGTLVMNSSRILKNNKNNNNLIYDVQKSRVWTGVLPHVMIKDPRAEISEFPFNPIVAIGKDAKRITCREFEQNNFESSCGPNSGWKFCSDNNAIVVGLGINLVHSATIMHVAEENHEDWPISDWYEKIDVEIINKNIKKNIVVKNRKSKWGKFYLCEKKFEKDLIDHKILKIENINDFVFSYLNSNELIDFIKIKNKKSTYPYLIPFFIK
tara:strand:- start:144 stop:1055 length:912 start_codon:yes stop_codon:yes gene_type:complete